MNEVKDFSGKNIDIDKIASNSEAKYVSLRNTKLVSLNSLVLEKFPNLIKLDVSVNMLSNFSFQKQFPSVLSINVSKNNFQNIEFCSNFPKLQQLIASHNPISLISLSSAFTNIMILDLSFSKLTNLDFLTFFPNLTDLIVNNCSISSMEGIDNLHNLKKLSINNNMIQNCPTISKSSLEFLSVNGNKISSISSFSQFKFLHHFNVANNPITFIDPNSIFQEVKRLNIGGTQIATVSMIVFAFPKLEKLNCSDTKIDSLNEITQLISNSRYLSILKIKNTPILSNCKNELKSKIRKLAPNLKISYENNNKKVSSIKKSKIINIEDRNINKSEKRNKHKKIFSSPSSTEAKNNHQSSEIIIKENDLNKFHEKSSENTDSISNEYKEIIDHENDKDLYSKDWRIKGDHLSNSQSGKDKDVLSIRTLLHKNIKFLKKLHAFQEDYISPNYDNDEPVSKLFKLITTYVNQTSEIIMFLCGKHHKMNDMNSCLSEDIETKTENELLSVEEEPSFELSSKNEYINHFQNKRTSCKTIPISKDQKDQRTINIKRREKIVNETQSKIKKGYQKQLLNSVKEINDASIQTIKIHPLNQDPAFKIEYKNPDYLTTKEPKIIKRREEWFKKRRLLDCNFSFYQAELDILALGTKSLPSCKTIKITRKSNEHLLIHNWLQIAIGKTLICKTIMKNGNSDLFMEFEKKFGHLCLFIVPTKNPSFFFNQPIKNTLSGFRTGKNIKQNKFLICACNFGNIIISSHPCLIPSQYLNQKIIEKGYDSILLNNNHFLIINPSKVFPLYSVSVCYT